ncbi:MAG TPA: DUF6624 domain-containing protein [Croceibacterium sp.]
MMLRYAGLCLAALCLCAADEPSPPPPETLAPYIAEGAFDPGDFAWMKGRFADADEPTKADVRAIDQWLVQCIESAKVGVRQELAARGYRDAKLETTLVGPLVCRQAFMRPNVDATDTYAVFAQEAAAAVPVAEAYLFAVRVAQEAGGPRGPGLAEQLLARPLAEQVVRTAVSWGEGMAAGAPELTPIAREIVRSRLMGEIAALDTANALWLKDIVAREGWPEVSAVGEKAADEAWLLVQHADHDPVFQLDALLLMEPLVAQREVSPRNFAYLYDRVMLKLAGKQRYATQFTCIDGKWGPQPIEDEAAVDRLRREAQMETLAENVARMDASYGRC